MKILALAADRGGCGFYRMMEPARVTSALGVDITVDDHIDVEAKEHPVTRETEVTEVKTDADVIIIQRPLNKAFTAMIKQAKRQGIATIVEIDDDFEALHRANLAYDAVRRVEWSGPQWIRTACEEADLVTISTPALSKFALHGRFEVLRNNVPESIFDITPAYERYLGVQPVVGWTGTLQTHPTDLQETKGGLRDAGDFRLHIVGDGEGVLRALKLDSDHPHTFTGWVPIEEYYENVANMDIGIVPLEISPFNQAKSALKGMEMAALGVPFVASPTREYERLAAYGVGTTASGPSAWRKQVSRLVERSKERVKLAEQYRETVYNEMTYERNAESWIKAWEQAVQHRKSNT